MIIDWSYIMHSHLLFVQLFLIPVLVSVLVLEIGIIYYKLRNSDEGGKE